jgi:two-component system chemotaxis response regulator CheY
MRILIAEDNSISGRLMLGLLRPYGDCDLVADGLLALAHAEAALAKQRPYDLLCLDIMMPGLDGQRVLDRVRAREGELGILGGRAAKVVMTSALDDAHNILGAFRNQADAYLVKPIDERALAKHLAGFGFAPARAG